MRSTTISLLLLLVVASTPAAADTLLVDKVKAGEGAEPVNGTAMSTVESRYGEPESREGPVGDPPITRWDYAEFSVYFEHDSVIHTVVRR
ncbi:hypothetical protein [Arhodomonas sp. AD133]|uniref:hypothetical protein n=1 Tax=Arhodomonas sp. AD133 TaxID=3415009 RepID=UPI003EBA187A